ncbi:MAG: HAMP domain-containing protein [Chitinispirillaceae bacterium]|nr:HAMP domain-containing protein [Chitinispirillaceae bacterium]
MNNLTLKAKTFILITVLVLLTTGPLVFYYLQATQGIGNLGTDPQIESSLSRCIELSTTPDNKEQAAHALKRYGQIKVLKDRIVTQVVLFSVVYSVAVIALLLAAGYVMVSRITRPLKNLTAATRRIAADRLDEKLPETVGGEIGDLVRAFNTMAHDLKTAREQRAIAERRATWQHVARTIAHEIKNPLTPIKLSTERMYEKYLTESRDFPEVIKSTTQTVLTEIGNLQKLVDSFHRYAKFPDPVLKSESFGDIAKETAALFTGGKAAITCTADASVPQLMLDRGQIREALTNLIKNAIEATEAVEREPHVSVTVTYDQGLVTMCVKDNGCGISQDNIKKLFQPYYTTKKQGSGIGLALVERIVTLHGGSLSVQSEEGHGTEIRLHFKV